MNGSQLFFRDNYRFMEYNETVRFKAGVSLTALHKDIPKCMMALFLTSAMGFKSPLSQVRVLPCVIFITYRQWFGLLLLRKQMYCHIFCDTGSVSVPSFVQRNVEPRTVKEPPCRIPDTVYP